MLFVGDELIEIGKRSQIGIPKLSYSFTYVIEIGTTSTCIQIQHARRYRARLESRLEVTRRDELIQIQDALRLALVRALADDMQERQSARARIYLIHLTTRRAHINGHMQACSRLI